MADVNTAHTALSRKSGPGWQGHLGRTLIGALSRSGIGASLSILIYHRVLPQRDPLFPGEVDAQAFDEQIGLLNTCFNIIPLSDAVKGVRQGNLPARAACITFDDGYADNAEIALPILQKHEVPATFFIATGFLDGGRMWNDTVIELVRRAPGPMLDLDALELGTFEISSVQQRRQAIFALLGKLKYLPFEARREQIDSMCSLIPVALPDNLMMRTDQVRTLHNAGMGIGGHTVNHPILARLEAAVARSEIAAGRETLEDIVRAPVRLFAYPNGKPGQDYLADHVRITRELGFDAAVSTAWGAARSGSDLHQLPRFTPWDRNQFRFVLRMAQNMMRKAQTL